MGRSPKESPKRTGSPAREIISPLLTTSTSSICSHQ